MDSSLASAFYQAKYYSKGRGGRNIEMITIHHMASVISAKRCGEIFQNRQASSHYGIGVEGEIAQYVNEADTSWANANWDSNCKAITIETSNDSTGGEWHVGDKALNSLIKLVADIAKRRNLGTLVKGKNVTWHRMYCATTCPGEYLLSKMDYIVSEANKINQNEATKSVENTTKVDNGYLVKVTANALNIREGAGTNYNIVGCIRDKGTYTILETQGNWGKLKSGAGWICLDYTIKTNNTVEIKKTLDELAKEVITGKWGNGTDRKIRLTNAGYDYNAVQKRVNQILD